MDMTEFANTTAEYGEVLYDVRDWVARITINRESAYNAYSTRALVELAHAFRRAAFDDHVAVIVFTGAGTRAFCTGGDVKEYAGSYTSRPRDYWKYMTLFGAYIESILNTGKPVIARLNGMAVGGGNADSVSTAIVGDNTATAQGGVGWANSTSDLSPNSSIVSARR